MKLGFWFLLVAGCFGVVFDSGLLMFLFGPSFFGILILRLFAMKCGSSPLVASKASNTM